VTIHLRSTGFCLLVSSRSGHAASIASLQYDQSLNLLLTASLDKVIKVHPFISSVAMPP
jgi:hypothetical protein